jgi:hypothetical protein
MNGRGDFDGKRCWDGPRPELRGIGQGGRPWGGGRGRCRGGGRGNAGVCRARESGEEASDPAVKWEDLERRIRLLEERLAKGSVPEP